MKFSERIKIRRIELGLSLSEVAELIGEPVSTYLGWENGRKITGEKVYPKLAVALQLSLSELITSNKSSISDELTKIEISIRNIRLLA